MRLAILARIRDPLSELDSGKDELDYSEFPDDASSGNFYQFQTRADSELFANIMKRIQANNGDDDDEEDGFEDAEEGNLGAASETVSGGGGRKVGDSQHPSKSSKRETLDSAAEKLGSNVDDNLLSNLNLGAAGMPNIYLKTGETGGGSSYGLQPPKFTNFLKKTIHGVFNSVSQGYAKRMTERHKANISFFGVFRESLDPAVWEEVQKHQAYAIVNANHDGWGLLLLVRNILSVQSTLHINLAKSTAEREYASFKMQSKDTLNDFRTNYLHQLTCLQAAGLPPISDADQARHFLDRLDMKRFSELYHRINQDAADGSAPYPINLAQAYQRARTCLTIVQPRIADGSGKAFGSMALVSDDIDNSGKGFGSGKASGKRFGKTSGKGTGSVKGKGKDGNKSKSAAETKGPCHNCGKMGHFKAQCPDNKRDGAGKQLTKADKNGKRGAKSSNLIQWCGDDATMPGDFSPFATRRHRLGHQL